MRAATEGMTRTHVQASAHRGDSSRFRENTLPAIRSAIAAGAGFVEIDVRTTSDGAVVVLHDPTLDRLWGRSAEIAQTTCAELRELGDREHRPPLLSEVLELFENSPSTLLIDMDDASFAAPAHGVVAGSTAPIAWCGDLEGMRTIRSLEPSARIWMPWASSHAPTAADLDELAPECVNMDHLVATREMVQEIHRLGYQVTVWTVDDETAMRWALDMGADVVTTNQLSRLQRILGEDLGDRSIHGAGTVDIDEAVVVARGLARWVIDFTRTAEPGQISTKINPADLVTEVDVLVERRVRDVIGRHFPEHGFVGEEMGGTPEPGVPCWYLDPVDGTTNFANAVPWNAFSLALVVDGSPVVAVVADPWRGDLFEAVSGRGAWLNGSQLRIAGAHGLEDPLAGRVVSTELAGHVPWPGMLEMLAMLGDRFCTMRIMGSGTMTLVGIAAGRGVGAVIGQFGAVDHVAATLIVHEAGGVVLDSAGGPSLFPSDGGIMAASPEAAGALYQLWRQSCEAAAGHE
jgi:myo-inositol-1(or 4)-monophosphatase